MSTIYSRCHALVKLNKIPRLPTHDQMAIIGRFVIRSYKNKTDKWPAKILLKAGNVEYQVFNYPGGFSGEIDRIVLSCLEKGKEKNLKNILN